MSAHCSQHPYHRRGLHPRLIHSRRLRHTASSWECTCGCAHSGSPLKHLPQGIKKFQIRTCIFPVYHENLNIPTTSSAASEYFFFFKALTYTYIKNKNNLGLWTNQLRRKHHDFCVCLNHPALYTLVMLIWCRQCYNRWDVQLRHYHQTFSLLHSCLLYTSDAADER